MASGNGPAGPAFPVPMQEKIEQEAQYLAWHGTKALTEQGPGIGAHGKQESRAWPQVWQHKVLTLWLLPDAQHRLMWAAWGEPS